MRGTAVIDLREQDIEDCVDIVENEDLEAASTSYNFLESGGGGQKRFCTFYLLLIEKESLLFMGYLIYNDDLIGQCHYLFFNNKAPLENGLLRLNYIYKYCSKMIQKDNIWPQIDQSLPDVSWLFANN